MSEPRGPSKRRRPPMQPVVIAEDGVVRFQQNKLVQHLYKWAADRGCSLNELARLTGIPRSDREQLAQLLGYSTSGFSSLSYVADTTFDRMMVKERALLAAPTESPQSEPGDGQSDGKQS